MLSEYFLIGAIIVVSALLPFTATYMFRRGYEMGVRDYNTSHADTPKTVLAAKPVTATPEISPELKKYQTLLDNIENYDGTSNHQKEID